MLPFCLLPIRRVFYRVFARYQPELRATSILARLAKENRGRRRGKWTGVMIRTGYPGSLKPTYHPSLIDSRYPLPQAI